MTGRSRRSRVVATVMSRSWLAISSTSQRERLLLEYVVTGFYSAERRRQALVGGAAYIVGTLGGLAVPLAGLAVLPSCLRSRACLPC